MKKRRTGGGGRDGGELSLPQQNYIEVIADLCGANGAARTIDLAQRLGVRMPSVTETVRRLAEHGLVLRRSRHEIVLTAEGERIAAGLERRHGALRRFMVEVLAMAPDEADRMACRVEHCVDGELSRRLVDMADYIKQAHPSVLPALAARFHAGERPAAKGGRASA